MKKRDFTKLLKEYKKEYSSKIECLEKKYKKCMFNYNKEEFKKIMYEHRTLIKEIIYNLAQEFELLKKINCCIILNGSLARATNILYSDIDLNFFYDNKYFDEMIKIENMFIYILIKLLKYRGKDRIHSMVVYMPLIRHNEYNFINNNKYPVYLEDETIYYKCRENAQQLMYETYNSTRDINDYINYLNENDNEKSINEWANCFELVYDNNLYKEYLEKRIIYKSTENIKDLCNKLIEKIDNDKKYINEDSKKVRIKDLRYFYKLCVLPNIYNFMAFYIRIYKDINVLNFYEYEEKIDTIPTIFYDKFYEYLNLLERLDYIVDKKHIDLSFHSSKVLLASNLKLSFYNEFGVKDIIKELNKSKKEIYSLTKKLLIEKISNK